MKYIHIKPDGMRRYRRRVPKHLQDLLQMKELVRNLGRTDVEVLRTYSVVHDRVEALFRTDAYKTELTALELRRQAEAKLIELDFDPYTTDFSEHEVEMRGIVSDRILEKYAVDPRGGQVRRDDVSPQDHAVLTALCSGVEALPTAPTIIEAFDFYLTEKANDDPFKRKKQESRFRRHQNALLKVTGKNVLVTSVNRHHARKLRDSFIKTTSIDTVKRYFNDIKAVFNFVLREHEIDASNPFSGTSFPKETRASIDKRKAIPSSDVHKVYAAFATRKLHLAFWTLMHHTGAQNAEILGLTAGELHLDGPIPYIEIKANHNRSLKTGERPREIPLVGRALTTAQRLREGLEAGASVFGQYAPSGKHDTFGNVANRVIKEATGDGSLTAYGARHAMKDGLLATDAAERVIKAIMGHSEGNSSSAHYGTAVTLEQKRDALLKIDFAGMANPDVRN